MPCAESPRVQAYFDGEMDSMSAANFEHHLEHCAECRAALEDLEQVRTALRRELPYERAPPELRARVLSALDREGAISAISATSATSAILPTEPRTRAWRARPFWMGAAGGFGSAALAASLAFFLFAPPAANAVLDDLVSAHVRSLMPAHLIDVESTDRHTVKPWFAGHTDVSPVVADFADQGYRLVGGRADYFDHQRAAVVVYQHGPHIINVFSWAAGRGNLPSNATRNGYHLICWTAANLNYCAVSDTGWDELQGLARLLQDLGADDARRR